jgi:magnesium chelatase subunit I
MLINGEASAKARITDFWGVVPAITGKVELVYEGEQEGPYGVAVKLIGQAVKKSFLAHFPNPDKLKKGRESDPYGTIKAWFSGGNEVELLNDSSEKDFKKALDGVAGLRKFVEKQLKVSGDDAYPFMELVLHGLAEFNIVNKDVMESALSFRDILANMLDDDLFDDDYEN